MELQFSLTSQTGISPDRFCVVDADKLLLRRANSWNNKTPAFLSVRNAGVTLGSPQRLDCLFDLLCLDLQVLDFLLLRLDASFQTFQR